jgi:organic radical activating enzyme
MGKPISQEKQSKIFKLYKEGKTSTFIARQIESDWRTVKKYLEKNKIEKKELSPTAKKILLRQKKINFMIFKQLKDQVQKDQKYLSNLNDPLTGCGRHALARAAKEANQASNYSKLLIEAIDNAQQLIALFKGQQELLGFNEN